jgi:integrase
LSYRCIKLSFVASGAGLRLKEALRLRIKDIDLSTKSIFVYQGKGQKDRVCMLPNGLVDELTLQISLAVYLPC